MKKKINYLLLLAIAFMVGMTTSLAAEVNGTLKITGKNTLGKSLRAEAFCTEPTNCSLSNIEWYYNSTNSTTGGTRIENDGPVIYLTLTEDLVGKYIYVVATLGGEGYDSVTKTDITDATTNTTATVDHFIHEVPADDYSIDVKVTNESTGLKMSLNGASRDGYTYYVYFTDGNVPISETATGCVLPDEGDYNFNIVRFSTNQTSNDNLISVNSEWYILKGYEKAYVIKTKVEDVRICEITSTPITVSKPTLPALESRYRISLFEADEDDVSGKLFVFPRFPCFGEKGTHLLNVKLGEITDKELLRSLSKNKAENLSSLIAYAKNDNGKTYTIKDTDYNLSISNYDVKEGAFYYIYTTYKNEDNLYRNIDDIKIVEGKDGWLIADVDWSTLSDEETPTTTEETEETEETEVAEVWEYEIIYEANGGEGTMSSGTGKSNEPLSLAKNKFVYEKPKKRLFVGWNLYLQNPDGKREVVKDAKDKVMRFHEESKIENLKVPKGYKLVAVAEWSPATGGLVVSLALVTLLGISFGGYLILKKKKNYFAKL